MSAFVRGAIHTENALSRASVPLNYSHGRSPAYRRLASQLSQRSPRPGTYLPQSPLPGVVLSPLRSPFLPAELRLGALPAHSRLFHLTGRAYQEKPTTEPKPSTAADTDAEAKKESEEEPEEEQSKKAEDESGDKEGKEGEDAKGKKEDQPPPPPHGDKSPWEVFRETMSSEFQKSKEWNESTKQIGAAAHQFSESESVRRAREAYEKSTDAVSTTATRAVKSTASSIGKGAAWTWDTSMVKGVRKAANVTGSAVDKATKPIRDTEAYKNVKNVIDDGSSSRYGGWVEKEERRKKRELTKQQGGESNQVMEEDPK